LAPVIPLDVRIALDHREDRIELLFRAPHRELARRQQDQLHAERVGADDLLADVLSPLSLDVLHLFCRQR
jgi:hypothetical protein